MNKLSCILILLLLIIFQAPAISSDEIEITASVDKQTAYIGDLISYTITITYDSMIILTPPAVGSNLGQFDVKDYEAGEEVTIDGGQRRQVLWFSMRTFTTGEYIIPPLPIEYTTADSTVKVISSDAIKINILSVLAEGTEFDTLQLIGLREQASLAGDNTMMILIIIGSVIAAGIIIFIIWWVKYRKTEEEEFVDPRPSWEIAFTDLALLKNKNLLEKGELKKFYFELTEIIRRYAGKKFEFDAIDLTTAEINDHLIEKSVESWFCDELTNYLEDADLVKFAKYIPSEEQPETDWQKGYELVDKSRDLIYTSPEQKLTEIYIPGYAGRSEEEYNDLNYAPPELKAQLASAKTDDNDREEEE